MKFVVIFMACIAIAFAQYEGEAPSYAEGGHEAAGYAPEAGAYDGADPSAYAGHEGAAQAYPAGYEDGATGYGVESEGAVEHGDAYGAAGQYDAPQGGYEQFEAYV